jgi:hypothetical protein
MFIINSTTFETILLRVFTVWGLLESQNWLLKTFSRLPRRGYCLHCSRLQKDSQMGMYFSVSKVRGIISRLFPNNSRIWLMNVNAFVYSSAVTL